MIKENTIIKKDTLENWNKAKNFIPKKEEIIVYTDYGVKIGDGQTLVNDLPFVSYASYTVDNGTLIINTEGGYNNA